MPVVFDSKEDSGRDPEITIANRIAAKCELWLFLKDCTKDLTIEDINREIVIEQIAKGSVLILFPHFDFTEFQREVVNVLDTLVIPYSDALTNKLIPELMLTIIRKKE